ncbi:GNAT family N-acetyltransferase [Clostridium ganghwense]|uniref:GNAT family N-acetyltransferase n=1 Tax=Clostridium ganghwense TaxID=312089 RepID=A0ABT4CVN0_9CLOT|nr:GNAT family N-acetyltransferase [Clostridium ganghwense]MCY6371999.1 GNAT family N-acetyltransferase [Clostridium ganghwense]
MKTSIRLLEKKDTKIVMQYLERNSIETTFLIGNIFQFGLENNPNLRRCGDYYGYFEDGKLKGILPFYNLGSCIPHFETLNAVPNFIEIMKKKDFLYLLGMEKLIKPLYEGIKNYKSTVDYSQDSYYINKAFVSFSLEGAIIKNAKDVNKQSAVSFIKEANLKGFGRKIDTEEALKMLCEKSEEEDWVFLIKDEKIVAQANIQTFTEDINQIGGVYTSEEHRGKGYCKAIVSEICKRIIFRDKMPTLMVTKNNTPAVRAYSSLGFTHYDDYLIIQLKN